MYLLGYIPRDNRIYLCDKDQSVFSYSLPVTLIEYQTAILRGDFTAAENILPTVPMDQINKVARFLESQGLKEEALKVSTDSELKFDLAIQLNKIDIAHEIAVKLDTEEKWRIVSDVALRNWDFETSEKCMLKAGDIEGLFLMYQTSGNRQGLKDLSVLAGSFD